LHLIASIIVYCFPSIIVVPIHYCCHHNHCHCYQGAITQSDLPNKGESKMLEEHPPQKKEDGAAAGL
jgi:hypothetical protein